MKNIEKKIFNFGLCLCLALSNVITVLAGGATQQIDITNAQPSPIPGQLVAKLVGIKWDARSIPVQYSMNNTLDPIPNPLGPPVLTLAQAQTALQMSFDTWNNIPTSFIEMKITGTTANPGFAGFDFVNELTFRTRASFTVRASSFTTSLIADRTFADGDDLDEDGDSDFTSAITVCTDVDGDGDIEFPAGFYKAGTILDNDAQFNTKAPATNGLRFTVGDEALDRNVNSVDLIAIATHEFGHSHGLSHTIDNQISDTDGSASVMVPLVDQGDPASEQARRSLSSDDIAWSSYFYPEGSASSGPASLQPGDKAFDKEYGLIKGELRHGVLNQPIAGGSVFAIDFLTDKFVASGFSGTIQLSIDPNTGQRFLINDPAFHILNGNYVIPVPKGIYAVGVEPVDGNPDIAPGIAPPLFARLALSSASRISMRSFTTGAGKTPAKFGWERSSRCWFCPALNLSSGVDIVTSDSININNFGDFDTLGVRNSPPGTLFAVQIPASQITAVNPGGGLLIQGVAFHTGVADASVVPVFAKAMLTTGTVNGETVTIDLARPLAEKNNFVGQDNDFAPFYFRAPRAIGAAVLKGIERGEIQNLFIVLQLPTTTPFPGVSGQPPFIGFDGAGPPNGQPNDAPIFGLSYFSFNGGATWFRNPAFNIRFSLIVSKPLGQP